MTRRTARPAPCFATPALPLRASAARSLVSARRPPRRAATCMSIAEGVWQVDTMPDTQAPGMKVAIVGAGLAGLVTAMELVDAGCSVDIYDIRPFAGGKVGSWVDKNGNHIEMGLHVFFGCYYNVFDVMAKTGSFKHLLLKEHTHQFVNAGGDVRALDFRLGGIGAPVNGLKAFATTGQLGIVDKIRNAIALGSSVIVRGLVDFDGAMRDIRALDDVSFSEWFLGKGGSRGSIQRMWDPIAYALGFIDCDHMSARCMLTIFQLFAARSEASVLRMLEGSPDEFLTGPIVRYITDRGARVHLRRGVRNVLFEPLGDSYRVTGLEISNGPDVQRVRADAYVVACDVAGAKRLLPQEWRSLPEFQRLDRLEAVPVVTVQLRFNGWVTELSDGTARRDVSGESGHGLDNLLYSCDADFSCFADLAVTSPTHYFRPGEGSLLQCVLTPGDPYIPRSNEVIVARVLQQVRGLFPSSAGLDCTWSSVVKLAESLYREAPGMDPCRPRQQTGVQGLFMAGSYTYQDYIDSMEGACKSGRLAAKAVLESVAVEE